MPRDPEFDEIDALLNGDTDIDQLLGEDSIEEVDELDALLGSIDDDFLSDDEEVFLKNKEYLSNASTHELEQTFTKQQEEMMDNLEDILEEYSGGCMSGEHFGLDQDHEDIDVMEDLLDVVEFDGEFGLDDEDEFGVSPLAAGYITAKKLSPREQRLRRRIARTRKRKARRKGILDRVADDVTKTASGVAEFFNPQIRRQRRLQRSRRRMQRRSNRLLMSPSKRKVLVATRTKYIRLANNLKKSCLQFRRLNLKDKRVQKNLAGLPNVAVAMKPFQVVSSLYVSPFSRMSRTSAAALTNKDIRFNRRMNRRELRILKAAKGCDVKYQRLISIWKRLNRLGNTTGLESPREIIGRGFGWLKKAQIKAKRSVNLSQTLTLGAPCPHTNGYVMTDKYKIASMTCFAS